MCDEVLSLDNGTVEQTERRVTFKCDEHFYLEGSSSLTCFDGAWAGTDEPLSLVVDIMQYSVFVIITVP